LLCALLVGLRGSPAAHADGPAFRWVATWGTQPGPGELNRPAGITVDATGNIWIADTGNHRIQVFTAAGGFLRGIGQRGHGDGQFSDLRDVTVRDDRIYVADWGNNRVQILDMAGGFVRQIKLTLPGAYGPWRPLAAELDAAGHLYVLDESSASVVRLTADHTVAQVYPASCYMMAVMSSGDFFCSGGLNVSRVSLAGEILSINYHPRHPGHLSSTRALATSPDDSLWAYDMASATVKHYTSAGAYLNSFSVPDPSVVALAATSDRLFVLTHGSKVATYDWNGNRLGAWDRQAALRFERPDRLAVAPDGTLYVLERGLGRIHHLDGNGNTLTTFGSGLAPLGNLVAPLDIAVDALGRLYVLDDSWPTRVVRFTADRFDTVFPVGIFHQNLFLPSLKALAIVGDTVLILDNLGDAVRLDLDGFRMGEWPYDYNRLYGHVDVAATSTGQVYAVRRGSSPSIQVRTLLGAPVTSWGTGSNTTMAPGIFVQASGIAADLRGRVFVVDTDTRWAVFPAYSSRVQVFDEQGQYLGFWGGFGGENGQFDSPQALAALPDGRIVVADTGNNRLQVFAADGPLPPYAPLPGPTMYHDTPLPPLGAVWQDRSPIGVTSASNLLFPPAVGSAQPIIAVYAGGSLARSTDNGVSWQRLPGRLPGRLITCAGRETLITQPSLSGPPYRSTDWGLSWTRMGDAVATGSLPPHHLVQIAPSPTFDDDGILFASAYGSGFWRSTDRGDTWELRSLKGGRLDALAVALTANSQRVLFLGNYGDATPFGLLRSTDDGLTWQATHRAPNNIFVSPTFSQDQTVFDLIWTIHEDGVGRSTDGGVSWQQVGIDSLPSDPDVRWRGLAISPHYSADHTLILWASQYHSSGPITYQPYLSTDAGESWTAFGLETANTLQFLAFSPTYAQDHRIWRSEAGPGDRFQSTTDNGATWQPAGGLPGVAALGVAVSEWADETPMLVVSYDGVLAADSAGSNWNWLRIFTGSRPLRSTTAARSPAFARDGAALAYDAATTDGGRSWQPWVPYSSVDPQSSAAAYAPDFAASGIAVVAWDDYSTGGHVAISTDGGATWTWDWRSLPGLQPAAVAFAARWPAESLLYVGGEGGIAYTSDLGASWGVMEGPLRDLKVTGLASMAEGNQSILYATTATHGVWRSSDGGQTWTAFNNRLPNRHACALLRAGDLLLVRLCDGGIYLWQRDLNAWQPLGDPPPGGVISMALQRGRSEGIVWAGTGSGIYRTTFPAPELTPRLRFPLLLTR
jgi:sugar lactone lactonase YvrE